VLQVQLPNLASHLIARCHAGAPWLLCLSSHSHCAEVLKYQGAHASECPAWLSSTNPAQFDVRMSPGKSGQHQLKKRRQELKVNSKICGFASFSDGIVPHPVETQPSASFQNARPESF
jgi:hypothetical protein